MDESKVVGVFCLKNRTFYYMENGPAYSFMDLDRLRTTLIGRDLIKPAGARQPRTYHVMSLADARLEGHAIEQIYLSKNVQLSELRKRQAEEYESPWS